MKKIFITTILLLTAILGFCQNEQYTSAMAQALGDLGKSKTVEDYQATANQFERIANSEKSNWIPYYYAAYTTLIMSFNEKDGDKKDAYADIAQKLIDQALIVKSNESEIVVIQGMLYQARIMVHPMTRGQEYSVKANDEFEKASKMNENNPRAYYLLGKNKLNTPSFFGGGKDNALPLFKKAKEKYETFKPAEMFAPNWGQNDNNNLISKCESN